MKRIGVFCGSRSGTRAEYRQAAEGLGRTLAARGLGLVYGGGDVGLMGVVAQAALDGGAEVIGIIPQGLLEREVSLQPIGEMRIVGTMHERKAQMADLADGFVALPGGFGTLDETFEILTWAQLGLHAKPVGFLDTAGFYDHLFLFLEQAVREDLLRAAHFEIPLRDTDAERLLERMQRASPVSPLSKWNSDVR